MKSFEIIKALSTIIEKDTYEKIVYKVNQIAEKNSLSDSKYNMFLKTIFEVLTHYYMVTNDYESYKYFEKVLVKMIESYGFFITKLNKKNILNIMEFVSVADAFKLKYDTVSTFVTYCLDKGNKNNLDISAHGAILVVEDFSAVGEFNYEGFRNYMNFFEKEAYLQVAHALDRVFQSEEINYDLLYMYLNFKMRAINLLEETFNKEDFQKLERLLVLKNNDYYNEDIYDEAECIIYRSKENPIEGLRYFLNFVNEQAMHFDDNTSPKQKVIPFKPKS